MAKLGTGPRPRRVATSRVKVIGGLGSPSIAADHRAGTSSISPSTDANRIGLHYGGGVIEDKKFKSIMPPGATNKLIGPGDTVYSYPIDQRSYIIGGAGADTEDADEVTVVSKDNVRLGVRVQVYFTLNREPRP